MRKHLHEKGLLISVDDEQGTLHYAVRRSIGGRRRRVLHIRNILSVPESSTKAGEEADEGNSSKSSAVLEPDDDRLREESFPQADDKWATGQKWATESRRELTEIPTFNGAVARLAQLAHPEEYIWDETTTDADWEDAV